MTSIHEAIKVREVHGRYLPPALLHSLLSDLSPRDQLTVVGSSVANRPIHSVRMGSGPVRVLMWSQMHGNESTTTKALLDLVRGVSTGRIALDSLELLMIPMLNPDGAAAYTRMNANEVDLNRDALDLSQPESVVLREMFEDFKPHFCLNLHDQRTLFGVGSPPRPATLSLLAPAADPERTFPGNREQAARLAAFLASSFGEVIGVGRYDDTFNLNCVGDYFQAQGVPTLLFEAGHYPGDYEREATRRYVFEALMAALQAIRSGDFNEYSLTQYQDIPENRKCYVDILIRNTHLLDLKYTEGNALGIQYGEQLEEDRINFKPQIAHSGDLAELHGHVTWDLAIPSDLKSFRESLPLQRLFKSASGRSF